MAARSRYSDEFKRRAVDRVLDSGGPASTVAREVGVSPETLRRWVRQHRAGSTDGEHADVVTAQEPAPRVSSTEPGHGETPPTATPPAHADRPTAPWSPMHVDAATSSTDRVITQLVEAPDELFEAVTRWPLRRRMSVVLLAWCASVLASGLLSPPPSVIVGATVLHVLSLVLAFGSVVVIDWHGLLWLMGRRGLHESTRLAAAAGPLIWLGLAGLLASGALLNPDLGSPMAWTKLILVLAVALNGAMTSTTARLLCDLPRTVLPTSLPRHLQAKVFTATAVSQIGWWGAITIGFITTARRA